GIICDYSSNKTNKPIRNKRRIVYLFLFPLSLIIFLIWSPFIADLLTIELSLYFFICISFYQVCLAIIQLYYFSMFQELFKTEESRRKTQFWITNVNFYGMGLGYIISLGLMWIFTEDINQDITLIFFEPGAIDFIILFVISLVNLFIILISITFFFVFLRLIKEPEKKHKQKLLLKEIKKNPMFLMKESNSRNWLLFNFLVSIPLTLFLKITVLFSAFVLNLEGSPFILFFLIVIFSAYPMSFYLVRKHLSKEKPLKPFLLNILRFGSISFLFFFVFLIPIISVVYVLTGIIVFILVFIFFMTYKYIPGTITADISDEYENEFNRKMYGTLIGLNGAVNAFGVALSSVLLWAFLQLIGSNSFYSYILILPLFSVFLISSYYILKKVQVKEPE
ncbi:MAG: MFS transporter, partial [Candidatus Hodarchaeota archaeon]